MANTKITNPELFNLGDSTSATQLPVMTTTQRIAMTGLSDGEMIFNSTTDKVEYWDGTKWYGITYETDGFSVNYLIVAGGGGGGSAYGASGAGGGAGEYLTNVGGTSIVLETAITYTVIVGGGGAKGILGQNMSNGSSGSDSQFISTTYLARGGGGGNNVNGTSTNSGGSGGGAAAGYPSGKTGGASTAVAPGIGSAGGNSDYHGTYYASGGGGGAGSAGQTGNDSNGGGDGGAGLQNSITVASGSGPYYAAGGGGGLFAVGSPLGSYAFNGNIGVGGSSIGGSGNAYGNAFAGTVNTGSGGGGASYGAGSPYTQYFAGDGSSGVVILRFPTGIAAPTPTSSSNITINQVGNVAGYRIMTYTCTNVALDGIVTLTF
jgi:hypothetical protein